MSYFEADIGCSESQLSHFSPCQTQNLMDGPYIYQTRDNKVQAEITKKKIHVCINIYVYIRKYIFTYIHKYIKSPTRTTTATNITRTTGGIKQKRPELNVKKELTKLSSERHKNGFTIVSSKSERAGACFAHERQRGSAIGSESRRLCVEQSTFIQHSCHQKQLCKPMRPAELPPDTTSCNTNSPQHQRASTCAPLVQCSPS